MEKQLSREDKQEALFQSWLLPKDPEGNDLKFQSPEAEKLYKERVTGVKDAIHVTRRYKLVRREVKHQDTVITVGGVSVGNGKLVIIAGPCAVESES